MPSHRYVLVITRRRTRGSRRFGIHLGLATVSLLVLCSIPVLVGLGARWSARAELKQLGAMNQRLRAENDSYRTATGELTMQIAALQATVSELDEKASADPRTAAAVRKLPAVTRSRAMGGSPNALTTTRLLLSAAMTTPESTFGVLRDLLGSLESRLRTVRDDVERWESLASATPSVWPVIGWLTAGFGMRADPFTGEPAFHQGLDISTDKGDRVFATADGVVQSAGWAGEFGNLVVVTHDFGLVTRYAHLSRVAVTAGNHIRRGDVVGYVGATGRASGAHLHYEVWANGKPINPLRLLATEQKP